MYLTGANALSVNEPVRTCLLSSLTLFHWSALQPWQLIIIFIKYIIEVSHAISPSLQLFKVFTFFHSDIRYFLLICTINSFLAYGFFKYRRWEATSMFTHNHLESVLFFFKKKCSNKTVGYFKVFSTQSVNKIIEKLSENEKIVPKFDQTIIFKFEIWLYNIIFFNPSGAVERIPSLLQPGKGGSCSD